MSGIVGSAGSKSGNIKHTDLDYEQGFYDITMTAASGPITMSSTDNVRYTKIGQLVYNQGYVSTSGISSPSGALYLASLPFTSCANRQAHDGYSGGNHMWMENLSGTMDFLMVLVLPGGTTALVREWTGTTGGDAANHISSNTIFALSFCYTVEVMG